jgi:tRNA dimethylallyltransferase
MNLIIIIGQTATGKTKLALELAKKIPPAGGGELINFDSRQIYKYLDIITGKDIPKTKIWLYDIVTPDQYFSSYDYVQSANAVINDIQKRGKTPILVGGTYFYLKHLLYGFDYRIPPNFELREKLNSKSVEYLQKTLISLNSQTFENLNHSDQLNPRRLIRKIEIEKHQQTLFKKTPISPMNPIGPISQFIGLKYKDKNKLRQAIKKRVEKRLKLGAIEEVKKLLKMGYKPTDPGLKTIGYQQIIKYLNNQLSKEQAIKDWVNKEVQYAKRQYTFMKKDKNIEWREIN